MSKRKMLRLVEEGHVNGWDDPRMPTLQGMRRADTPPNLSEIFVKKWVWRSGKM
jgi:glutaminyl-tRNA synthetase